MKTSDPSPPRHLSAIPLLTLPRLLSFILVVLVLLLLTLAAASFQLYHWRKELARSTALDSTLPLSTLPLSTPPLPFSVATSKASKSTLSPLQQDDPLLLDTLLKQITGTRSSNTRSIQPKSRSISPTNTAISTLTPFTFVSTSPAGILRTDNGSIISPRANYPNIHEISTLLQTRPQQSVHATPTSDHSHAASVDNGSLLQTVSDIMIGNQRNNGNGGFAEEGGEFGDACSAKTLSVGGGELITVHAPSGGLGE